MATKKKIKAERIARTIVVGVTILLVLLFGTGVYMVVRSFSTSLGHRAGGEVIVPSLIGLTEEQADQKLNSIELRANVSENANSDEQPAGKIFKQDPAPGSRTRPGAEVNLIVSLGPASYTVPDLIGQPLDKVPAILARARLTLGQVERLYLRGTPSGRVVNQTPSAGTMLQDATYVDITVADSTSLPEFAMPDLTGKQLQEVEQALSTSNLQLSQVVYTASDSNPTGSVISQSPPPGREVKLGDKVEVQIAQSTAFMQAPRRTVTVVLKVPPGPPKQHVRIKFTDNLGTQMRGDSDHEPGDTVEEKIDLEGPAIIQIFIGDMKTPYREEKL